MLSVYHLFNVNIASVINGDRASQQLYMLWYRKSANYNYNYIIVVLYIDVYDLRLYPYCHRRKNLHLINNIALNICTYLMIIKYIMRYTVSVCRVI